MGNVHAKDPDFWCNRLEQPTNFEPDWMRKLPDNRRISELSIPGTHDTMTFKTEVHAGAEWVLCQAWPLSCQLKMGIRYLDLRCRHINNAFAMHHGQYYLDSNFDDVLSGIHSFLGSQPKEVILAKIQEEYKPENNTRSFDETLRSYFAKYPNMVKSYSKDTKLGDVRGKLVTINKGDFGENWNDWYEIGARDESNKKSTVRRGLDAAIKGDRSEMYATFSSCYSKSPRGNPEYWARCINPDLEDCICTTNGRLGVVCIDYPGYKIVGDIIRHNPKFPFQGDSQ